MRGESYQIILIAAGVIVATLFGVFLYREIFPEYKIYQNDYIALEAFRSTYTQQSPPPFKSGIKQIVIEREDKGPALVERCTSCHVALQIPYFSPTKIAHDLNGNIVRDLQGHPLLIRNDEYIWQQLDDKIAELRDEKVLEQLRDQGDVNEVSRRIHQADSYESLKTAHVGKHRYDVTKVLAMHPLMGNETRPFEYHPIEDYGCTSCHSGNGRGLVTDKAHGPVFDEQYEREEMGHTRIFTEPDPQNDPLFSKIFNHKPNEELLFQTEPILVGPLIQAKCIQCHQTSHSQLKGAAVSTGNLAKQRKNQIERLVNAYENEKKNILNLLKLEQMIKNQGLAKTMQQLKEMQTDFTLSPLELEHISSQFHYLEKGTKGKEESLGKERALEKINTDLVRLIGSNALVLELEKAYSVKGNDALAPFLTEHQKDPSATGSIFIRGAALDLNQDLLIHAQEVEKSFETAVNDPDLMSALTSDVDVLTHDYQRGEELYISQACYACHRISGFSRGGVGPELTHAGTLYPWYLKRKMVWPQGDLPTSTMPNMRLDHQELQDLTTFLLAQRGGNKATSETAYQAHLQAWEMGRKMPWEKPVSPAQMYDSRFAMTIYATQGCAACHRLQGFDSNVGFSIEKESPSFEQLYDEQKWFKKLFPEVVHIGVYDEELPGSTIADQIEKYSKEIDKKIAPDVRTNGILEEIDLKHPSAIESLYSPFRYAARSKNHYYENLIAQEKDPQKSAKLNEEWKQWKERVHRVLMMYIQTYGLGRLIGPHLNWAGIYRTDEWLMEHFRNPSGHVPRSIMPILPFDDTKFYALTHLLDELAIHNRNHVREIWNKRGFDPLEAYEIHCSQCHGIGLYGNGVIAEWIYPIPKNLHNAEFLRNLTKEKAIYSITHGVHGTPMPPWGEVAPDKQQSIEKLSQGIPVLTKAEIKYLVDWLFSSLPGGEVIRGTTDVPKWDYKPEDVLEELKKVGGTLHSAPANSPLSLSLKKSFNRHYASLIPIVYMTNKEKKNEQKESSHLESSKSNLEVDEIFDTLPIPSDTGANSYYIKKKYYTPLNIEEGRKFFLINCAYCHGNEGDGTGPRSSVMQEAKPRMLTNLDWIRSRDDLRLLRSIKYGVPGTSMTPWGDLTSSIQRLQLVIFIRSLSQEKYRRDKLAETLFITFETAQLIVENARIDESKQIELLQQAKKNLKREQKAQELRIAKGEEPLSEENLSLYHRNLEVNKQIQTLKSQDQQLTNLIALIKKEREIYTNLGISLIAKDVSDAILDNYINMIQLNENRYELEDHHLTFHQNDETIKKIRDDRKKIVEDFDRMLLNLKLERKIVEGKISSPQQREELEENESSYNSIMKLRDKLINDTEEALRLEEKQKEIVKYSP